MGEIRAVLLIPFDEDPYLLFEGPFGSKPPLVYGMEHGIIQYNEGCHEYDYSMCRCGGPWPCKRAYEIEWREYNHYPGNRVALVLAWGGKPVEEGCCWVQAKYPVLCRENLYGITLWMMTTGLKFEPMEEFGTLVFLDAEGQEIKGVQGIRS